MLMPASMPARGLVACPFCRQMFGKREASSCPECGLSLVNVAKLPLSYEAAAEEPDEPPQPHMEALPWSFLGRGRGLLLGLAALGMLLYFLPFVHERSPNIQSFNGFEAARRLGWLGAPFVAWFVMIPLVLTRRSIYRMRGSRLAVGFLGLVSLLTVVLRVAQTPTSHPRLPLRLEWGAGLWATGAVALAIVLAAFRFGGPMDDVPTRRTRRGDEVLH